jgi:glycosyltransferase involved in cell wall biosynthesis
VRYSAFAILRIIWKDRPAVVFSAIAHLNLGVALMRPLLPRTVRVVARETAVVSDTLRNRAGAKLWAMAYRTLYRRFDAVVCQSEAMMLELVTHFNVRPKKARVIHNPIDRALVLRLAAEQKSADAIATCPNEDDRICLVAAGRLAEVKGFDLLIEAIALLDDRRFWLTILGEGPLRADLEAMAHECGVADRVKLIGFQLNPYRFFAESSAFVLSSRSEACPNVVLEALVCGTPVIATPASAAIFEILAGQPDCVIATEVSAISLARAIAAYPFVNRRVHATRALHEYSPEVVCEQYSALFRSLTGRAT